MTEEIGLWAGLKLIYARMSAARRRQFFLVLALMVGGALAELATIGAVIPFLSLLANAPGSKQSSWLSFIGPDSGEAALYRATAMFMFLAIVAGLVQLQLAWSNRSFVFRLGHELTVEIQRRVLLQPFSFHIHRNTSTLLSALNKTEILVGHVLLALMRVFSAAFISIFIVAILLAIAPLTTLTATAAFAVIYLLISVATQKRLASNSATNATVYDDRMKIVQESLGGIRDVILDNSQSTYMRTFSEIDARLNRVRTTTEFIGAAPRYLGEMVGIVMIAAIALVAAQRQGGIGAALPILGALALGAQRILPLVQQIYASWSSVAAHRSIFGQVIELLELPIDESSVEAVAAPLELRRGITIRDVSFTYPTRRNPALDHVSLSIPRGSMLALVGPTGSGKSTLVDVMMGLLEPDEGKISIDDVALTPDRQRQWHRSVAHVPQSIFLADSTIARNIALSLPDSPPDRDRIADSARKAQLHEFILSLPSGYETEVGERGIRLSGGQRQRLGIARAIYKDAPILVLDEATSALDDTTEAAVISALDEFRRDDRTVIIVAHRLSTIERCDMIARLDRGKLVELTPKQAVFAGSAGRS